jgi:DNA-binding NarL/FixJ family response regulator
MKSQDLHFRLLVVDDESYILDLFRQILSRTNTDYTVHSEADESEDRLLWENASIQSLQLFDVVTCQQGEEAVDAVRSSLEEDRPFSVAFVDVRMSTGPDGIWTAEHIRALDPNIEIVIMTGYLDVHPDDIVRRIPPAHKLLYIQKPLLPREICQFALSLSIKWRTELELVKHRSSLEKVNKEIIETNKALSVLARNIDRDKKRLEEKIYKTTRINIIPIIKELQGDKNCRKCMAGLELLKTYLDDLVPSSNNHHHDIIISLTDQEMRVAVMIKKGLTSQKIANILNISLPTVKTHRKNIRKKLKIKNSKINLASYLRSKMISDFSEDHTEYSG